MRFCAVHLLCLSMSLRLLRMLYTYYHALVHFSMLLIPSRIHSMSH